MVKNKMSRSLWLTVYIRYLGRFSLFQCRHGASDIFCDFGAVQDLLQTLHIKKQKTQRKKITGAAFNSFTPFCDTLHLIARPIFLDNFSCRLAERFCVASFR